MCWFWNVGNSNFIILVSWYTDISWKGRKWCGERVKDEGMDDERLSTTDNIYIAFKGSLRRWNPGLYYSKM